MIELQDTFPYWQYSAILDGRTRPSHKALHGKIFKATDHEYYPPIGFRCRCTAIPLTARQAGKEPQDAFIKDGFKPPLNNAELVGNKQASFIKWLQNKHTEAQPSTKILIEKAIKNISQFLSSQIEVKKQTLKKSRTDALILAKKEFVGKSFVTHDGKKVNISNSDLRDIINQPHKNIIQKNKLVHSLDKLIQDSNFIKSAPETKGRAKYKKWYYYKYKNGYFLNVVELTNGELRLHSIGEAIK